MCPEFELKHWFHSFTLNEPLNIHVYRLFTVLSASETMSLKYGDVTDIETTDSGVSIYIIVIYKYDCNTAIFKGGNYYRD